MRTSSMGSASAMAAALLIAGCGGGSATQADDSAPTSALATEADSERGQADRRSAPPSPECLDDMEEAAGEPDGEAAQPILVRSLTSCETADQWMSALRRWPAAIGLKDASFLHGDEVDSACISAPDAPVCRDLEDQ